MYEKLFSPANIGKVKIKNRLVMSPMGTGIANLDGTPSDEMIRYYEERAKGGVGLIYTEVCRVNDINGAAILKQLSLTNERNIPRMSEMVSVVHKYGTKIFCQLHHPGRETNRALIGGNLCVGASDKMCLLSKQETRALSTEEVKGIISNYITAAKRAKEAGFDGVEIHAAHGYLPGQFLSPYTNNRSDEYGGSFENRMRFVVEIIEGIHKECGFDYPITVRFSTDELLDMNGVKENYIHSKDGVEIAKGLEKAGIDGINVSCGIYETGVSVIEPTTYSQAWRTYLIKPIKEAVSIPVIAVNNVREPKVAEELLEEGVQDFVALGRALICDPFWANKALEGREDEIRKCIGCLRCFESLNENSPRNMPPECSMNPRAFKELKYDEERYDSDHHKVLVIGGGPAGMSAAVEAARRGMSVTLLEKEDKLGGIIYYASKAPKKEMLDWLTDWYQEEMQRLGVDIRLGVDPSIEYIEELSPDSIIVSTGAKAIVPSKITGINKDNVYGFEDILDIDSKVKNQKVIVIGSGITGLECASQLNHFGCETTVIDMLDSIAPGANPSIVQDDVRRLMKEGTQFKLSRALMEVRDDCILVKNTKTNEIETMKCDSVALSLGITQNNQLFSKLKDKFDNIHLVGAARDTKGLIHGATAEGFECVYNLFEIENRPSFKLADSDLKKYSQNVEMRDQEGVTIAFLTEFDAIKKILPPPLKPYLLPIANVSLSKIKHPTFTDEYYEAVLGIYAMYNDQLGIYPLSLLIDGAGSEVAQLLGREVAGWPKKVGAVCELTKDGDLVTAKVSRHGKQLLDMKMKIGSYNSPLANLVFQQASPNKDIKGQAFCYKYDQFTNEEGNCDFKDAVLVSNICDYHYKDWKPGFASISLSSSKDDPWGELPISSVIGAAYQVNDLYLPATNILEEVEARKVVPYLIPARYDRTVLMEVDRI
ncbi:MAG: FAD-dependent oxidoreductase [Peptostreptococcus sp.]|uniref:FAD-dependent oxidoreductase n=1 Tax=Peptostreptococcus sp. TaxID=1262 RepID=UPI002FCC2CD2